MHRIDGAGVVGALPAPLAVGVPGYFNNAPGAGAGTVVDGDWLNAVQEELLAVILATGVAADKANRAQLLAALRVFSAKNFLMFKDAGTTNWVVPAGITKVFAQLWGAGGGADAGVGPPSHIGSGGGSAGGYAAKLCTVVPAATIALTVGAKGVKGSPATNGGTTSFGVVFSATGGQRGAYNGAGGAPGSGVGGDINVSGAQGGQVQNLPSHVLGATGGGSPFGGAGGALGMNGGWPGGGGGGSGGGDGQAHLSGDGADGGILLMW
jgi:hypothetical protein